MDRRSFLKLLGVAGTGLIVEPRSKIWQVSRWAPVPHRAEADDYFIEVGDAGELVTSPDSTSMTIVTAEPALSRAEAEALLDELVRYPGGCRDSVIRLDVDHLDSIDMRAAPFKTLGPRTMARSIKITQCLAPRPPLRCEVCGRATGGCCTVQRLEPAHLLKR